jgi:hypothetical protein
MPKQCVECRTVVNDGAPYCESCGCQFSSVAATPVNNSTWQFVSIAAVVGVLGIGLYFFEFR